MKTTDLFTSNRSATKLNESLERVFGKRINLEGFDLEQLQDARNKLRTQISQVRSVSGFNETIENEALTQAQWMLDAINAEIAEREEFVVDPSIAEVEEGVGSVEERVQKLLDRFEHNALELGAYGNVDTEAVVSLIKQGDYEGAADEVYGSYSGDDGEEVRGFDLMVNDLQADFEALGGNDSDEDGETDDNYAMASAGFGSDEDYGDFPESIEEKAPPGSKAERMVKHIKKGYAKDGKLTDKEKSIAYATAWKQHNKEKNESTESGEVMTKLQEGEIQQAQSIVTAKTMVDRVGRWIEELSGMENDTLLQLGDQIRDEMGQEQAKSFISAVAPAIQQALENLKSTRETLATGVRTLTGEQQPAEMLGSEPAAPEGGEEMGAAAPDAMNAEPAADEFAAAEPAAGGLEDTGREQRESIEYQNKLLRVLAG